MKPFRAAAIAASLVLASAACSSLPDELSQDQGTLLGAAGGATAGAILGDGGIILPAIGAVGGAVLGEEAAENDPIFD